MTDMIETSRRSIQSCGESGLRTRRVPVAFPGKSHFSLFTSRVAVIGTSTSQEYAHELKEIELAAKALGVKLQHVDVLAPKDIEPAFQAAAKARADAVLWVVSARVAARARTQTQIVDLAVKNRLPAIHESRTAVEAGALMSYGVSLCDLDRCAAVYVDKILKGAKPVDLPIEQPKKFEFIINLKTAKQIGRSSSV
jgi:putative tryptophan/tyrosine transport system substrate-binding protein